MASYTIRENPDVDLTVHMDLSIPATNPEAAQDKHYEWEYWYCFIHFY
jgi:hypothetical protein